MNHQSVDLNHQLEVRKLLEAAIKKITYQISLHIIVKMPTKKGPPKTPPSKGPATRKSPRNQKAGERKRSSGLVRMGREDREDGRRRQTIIDIIRVGIGQR